MQGLYRVSVRLRTHNLSACLIDNFHTYLPPAPEHSNERSSSCAAAHALVTEPSPKVQLCLAFCWETRYKTQHRLVVYAFTLVIQSEMKKWLIEGSHGLAHGRTSVSLQRMWQGVFAAAWPEAASSRGPFRRGDLPVHALQQTFRNANKTKQTRAKSYRRKTVSVWGMWSEVSAVECADLPQANSHRTTVVPLWRLSSQICTTS